MGFSYQDPKLHVVQWHSEPTCEDQVRLTEAIEMELIWDPSLSASLSHFSVAIRLNIDIRQHFYSVIYLSANF